MYGTATILEKYQQGEEDRSKRDAESTYQKRTICHTQKQVVLFLKKYAIKIVKRSAFCALLECAPGIIHKLYNRELVSLLL